MNGSNALITRLGAALAAPGLAASGGAGVRAGSSPVVTIDGGAVRGFAVMGGYAFRGLTYAAPPIGHLRWRPPQPPAPWRGVRDASRYAPSCLQRPSRHDPPLCVLGRRVTMPPRGAL
jgi:para-nitrobenzyl esterase